MKKLKCVAGTVLYKGHPIRICKKTRPIQTGFVVWDLYMTVENGSGHSTDSEIMVEPIERV